MTERIDFLAQVASMYYEDNLTQEQIAKEIGGSRSTVSRLLNEARESGVVEITIHHPWKTDPALERALVEVHGLQQAVVLTGGGRNQSEILRGLGILASRCVHPLLIDGSILGISWGTAVHSTVQALRPAVQIPLTVVQMIGAVGMGDPLIDGPDLARLLANTYGGEYRYLHAPLIVESQQVREAFHQELTIQETLELARKADIALVGIGSLDPLESSLRRAGYLDEADLANLSSLGAVGDICARHYDSSGQVLEVESNRRIVGIELDELRNIDRVIAVAGGVSKAEAIRGALRGGYVNVLVTDDLAAQKVLELDHKSDLG
jgi:DNA-binding transcriptional regulator LsrR (DeoR family)